MSAIGLYNSHIAASVSAVTVVLVVPPYLRRWTTLRSLLGPPSVLSPALHPTLLLSKSTHTWFRELRAMDPKLQTPKGTVRKPERTQTVTPPPPKPKPQTLSRRAQAPKPQPKRRLQPTPERPLWSWVSPARPVDEFQLCKRKEGEHKQGRSLFLLLILDSCRKSPLSSGADGAWGGGWGVAVVVIAAAVVAAMVAVVPMVVLVVMESLVR